MKKTIIIIVLSIAILVMGFLILNRNNPAKQVAPIAGQTTEQSGTNQHWASKTDNQSMITVVVTPLDILSQSKEWTFNIAMNNHSVELQDPTKSTVLIDDSGKEYKPVSWSGPTTGGHHMNGVLTFNQIMPIPKSIELKISGVGGVDRSFTW